jgi:hypothetical protein
MKKIQIFLLILIPLLLITLLSPYSLIAQEDFETIYPTQPETVIKEGKTIAPDVETELTTQDNIDTEEEEVEETIIDEHTKVTRNRYFDLTLERKHQTPFGNFIPYILTVTPHINSPRTQILWNVPTTLEARPKHREFVALEKDQTYIFEGRIKPLKPGVYDFSISVMSWQHDTNYTNSISDSMLLDKDLVLQPVSSYYQNLTILKYALFTLAVIALIALVIVLGKKYAQKAKRWLTPPF